MRENGVDGAYWFWRGWHFVSHQRTRYVAAWIGVLVAAGITHYFAYRSFQSADPDPAKVRRDGGDGHCTIDFGGQWLMGRMLVRGYGRELYNRNRQYEVAWQAFPRDREAPAAEKHDAEELVGWFMDAETPDSPFHDRKRYDRLHYSRATRTACAMPLATQDPLQALVLTRALQEPAWTYVDPHTEVETEARGPHTPEAIRDIQLRHVGGPLYPPIHALMIAPLALDDEPQLAYRFTQLFMLAMAFVGGLGVSVLTERRIWWPVAAAMIMFFPGFRGSHHLGQNAALSLAILIWGWVLMNRNRELLGGALWGLLAFKPTIAAAFFLAPLLTRRWKACLSMLFVGAGLAAATLPFVGIQSWLDWLKIGQVANEIYNVDENWIFLSRDLLGVPRRFLVDFGGSYYLRDRWYMSVAGWFLWVLVVETTLRISLVRPEQVRAATGPGASIVLLGAWASCFHFMYYDALLSFLGVVVLFAEPRRLVQPILALFPSRDQPATLTPPATEYYEPRLPKTHPAMANGGRPLPRALTLSSFLVNAYVALVVIQHLLPWMSMTGTFVAPNWFPAVLKTTSADGSTKPAVAADMEKTTVMSESDKTIVHAATKPAIHTPKLEISTSLAGPPWDTFALLVIWAWACVMTLRLRAGAPATDHNGRSGDVPSLALR